MGNTITYIFYHTEVGLRANPVPKDRLKLLPILKD